MTLLRVLDMQEPEWQQPRVRFDDLADVLERLGDDASRVLGWVGAGSRNLGQANAVLPEPMTPPGSRKTGAAQGSFSLSALARHQSVTGRFSDPVSSRG